MSEQVELGVWKNLGSEWVEVGAPVYESLQFEPRFADVGTWSMLMSDGAQASSVQPGRLVTTTFRDNLHTWAVTPVGMARSTDDGLLERAVGGFDALWILGWATAWPNPAAALSAQPAEGSYSGAAETVIRSLVVANLGTRYGMSFDAPASAGRGSAVTSRPRFDNLQTEVLRLAKLGNINPRFGLVVNESTGRARLTLWFEEPRDKTLRVELSAVDGSVASWELRHEAPSLTKAFVGGSGEGAGQYLRSVTTTASTADATEWGGHREGYIDGPDTFDNTTLDDAGRDALAEGAAVTTLSMEAQEPKGTKAFIAFRVGDVVTCRPHPDVTPIEDTVTAIRVDHTQGGDPVVAPVIGDPDTEDPDAHNSTLIRALRRELQNLKINRKRGTV